ncbi:Ubiquitin-conjugating enzyme E2 6, partial [Irineochytrium annulatum]
GTWNPAWSVATILTGLLSFMLEETPTTGSIKTSIEERRVLAKNSHAWNLQNPKFRAVFPELCVQPTIPHPNPSSRDLTQRHPSKQTAAAEQDAVAKGAAAHHHHAAAGAAASAHAVASRAGTGSIVGQLLTNAWQGVRSNVWRLLLLGVFLYLIVLKVASKVNVV